MKARITVLFAVATLGLAAGCCRYTDYLDYEDPDNWIQACVINLGAPEVDGCGWMIKIGDEYYYPVNLEDKYLVDALPVKIRYTYDPVDFRCGLGGKRYPSIRISKISIDAPMVMIMKEGNRDRLRSDGFRMDSAFVNDDFLFLHVSYSGGCRKHGFSLWKLLPNALDPPPVELMLVHDSKDDRCEAWLSQWLVFSLEPLRKRDKHEVSFSLRGSPEMSAYFGEFVYKY